jgi:hypothetical protein
LPWYQVFKSFLLLKFKIQKSDILYFTITFQGNPNRASGNNGGLEVTGGSYAAQGRAKMHSENMNNNAVNAGHAGPGAAYAPRVHGGQPRAVSHKMVFE